MTDKQIIIDEIDVSRCRHYDDRYGYCEACRDDIDGASFTKCLYEDNCYYKQLKRSEAQCEAMFVTHTDLEKAFKAKEQECEGLKEEIKNHNDDMFKNPPEKRFYCKGCTLPYISKKLKAENKIFKETLDDLFKVQYKLADNCKKLRQCLTEIKEIAEHCIKQDICTTCDNSEKCHIEDEEIPTYDVCKLILQKISECEVK